MPDGVIGLGHEKHGRWLLAGPDELPADLRTGPVAVGGPLNWWPCRGVGIDVVARRYAFFPCTVAAPAVGWLESTRRRLAASPGWRGWRVEVAWGGALDLVDVPFAERHAPPYPVEPPRPAGHADALVDWDEPAGRLRLSYDAAASSSDSALVSVIRDDLRVLDHRLLSSMNGDGVQWLFDRSALLSALTGPPYDTGDERGVPDGAVIDVAARTVRYWTAQVVSPPFLDVVRRSWAGWQVERLPFGFAGHLAATGRAPGDLLIPDGELLADTSREVAFDPGWLADRRALRPDPRPLRPIRVSYPWADTDPPG